MTYLQVVNRILRRLRESEVGSVNATAYSKLIGEFVNDIKDQMQEEHPWGSMKGQTLFDSIAATRVYDLSATLANGGNVDNASNITTETTRLLYEQVGYFSTTTINRTPLAMVWDVTEQDAAGGFRLGQIDRDKARARLNVNTSSTANRPSFFSLQYKEGANSTLGLEITLHEVPTDVRSYAVDCYLPQGYLDSTVDDDTVIQVPSRPLILGAYMLALNERGEELGEPGGLIEQRFLEAKDDSIQTDLDAAANLNLLDVATD